MKTLHSENQPFSGNKPKYKGNWHYLTLPDIDSWYMYLQCSAILNNHNSFVLGLLIMKNDLDDDSNVMWIFQTTL